MKEILRRARCLLVYLPPYSPQLNPIERCWVAVKCKVRQWLDRGMDLLQAVRQAFVEYIILGCIAINTSIRKPGITRSFLIKKRPLGAFLQCLKDYGNAETHVRLARRRIVVVILLKAGAVIDFQLRGDNRRHDFLPVHAVLRRVGNAAADEGVTAAGQVPFFDTVAGCRVVRHGEADVSAAFVGRGDFRAVEVDKEAFAVGEAVCARPLVKAVGRRLVVFAVFAGYPDIGDGARRERCGLHVGCHGLLLWVDDRCSITVSGVGGVSGLVQEVSDFAVLHGLHPTFKIATGADVTRGHAEMGAEGFGKRL